MKKYALLISLLLVSISSFSQSVILDSITSKKVIVDLIKGDACEKEVFEVKKILSLTELKVVAKDKIIANNKLIQDDFTKIIFNQNEIIESQQHSISKLEKKTTFYKIVAIAGILTGGYFALR